MNSALRNGIAGVFESEGGTGAQAGTQPYARHIPEAHEIPPELRELPIWCAWRLKPEPEKKPGKRPVSPHDGDTRWQRETFCGAFEQAHAYAEAHPDIHGLGIILRDGCGIAGGDLDHCRDPETGELTEFAAQIIAEVDTYAEVSPGLDGVRFIARGSFGGRTVTNHELGVELYESGRFLTITGNHIESTPFCIEHRDLRKLGRRLSADRRSQTNARSGAGEIALLPAQIAALRSALASMRSDDRDLWIRMGQALKKLGETGRGLWLDWSQTSEKYDPPDAARVWDSLTGDRTGYQAVFAEAQRRGWVNPASRVQPDAGAGEHTSTALVLSNFLAYLPEHKFIYRPTGDLWPAESLNGALECPKVDGKDVKPSKYLDKTSPVQQMTWAPGEPEIIENRLAIDGGWLSGPGSRTYNLYRPPQPIPGDPNNAELWKQHLVRVYDKDAEHLLYWLAQRIQDPATKINHALVLGGSQGIGKDTLLEPVVAGVGQWNFAEISPSQMLGRFNGWVKSVILRVNEGRDLGDVDRFAFYDHAKTYIAAPPDVLRVDEKNRREYPVFNKTGVILTTNHKLDGIYLPPDDRRHYVAWSECTREDFDSEYWRKLWSWYGSGGIGHVVAFLRTLDLSEFNPKAPPPRSEAFEAIVAANHNPEELELSDLLERLGWPSAITVRDLIQDARSMQMFELADNLSGSRNARKIPHRLDRAGYELMTNTGTKDGRWKRDGQNVAAYVRQGQTVPERYSALRSIGINA